MADPNGTTQDIGRTEPFGQVPNEVKKSPRETDPSPFQPVNITDVRRVGGRDKRREETKSVRSEAHEPNNRDGDNYSDIPDGVQQDLGSGIFITYFLHALEVERLIMINKYQMEEAIEMDNEIQVLEQQLQEQKDKYDEELKQVKLQGEQTARDHELALHQAKEDLVATTSKLQQEITELHELLQTKEVEIQTLSTQGGMHDPEVLKTIQSLEASARESSSRQADAFHAKLAQELSMNTERLRLQHTNELEQLRAELQTQKEVEVRNLKASYDKQVLHFKTQATTHERDLEEKQITISKLEEAVAIMEKQAKQRNIQVDLDKGSVDRWPASSIASPREANIPADHRWADQLPSDYKSPAVERRFVRDELPTPGQEFAPQHDRPAYRPLMSSGGARSRGCSSETSERGGYTAEVRSADHALDSRRKLRLSPQVITRWLTG